MPKSALTITSLNPETKTGQQYKIVGLVFLVLCLFFAWMAYGPGLHLALYYSYSTNKADNVLTYNVDKLNNFGFRIGLSF